MFLWVFQRNKTITHHHCVAKQIFVSIYRFNKQTPLIIIVKKSVGLLLLANFDLRSIMNKGYNTTLWQTDIYGLVG